MNQPDSESRFPRKVLPVAALLALGLCRQGEEKEKIASPRSLLSATSKNIKTKVSKATPELASDPVDFTSLPPDVDTVIRQLQKCVRAKDISICTNPDPNESMCIPTRQDGGYPVSMVFNPDLEGIQVSLRIGSAVWDYPLDLSEPTQLTDQVRDVCDRVRGWMLDPDEMLLSEGICPSDWSGSDCDDYLDALREKGSGGFELQRASDALNEAFSTSSIEVDRRNATLFEFKDETSDADMYGSVMVRMDDSGDAIYHLGFTVDSLKSGISYSQELRLSDPKTVERCIASYGKKCG